jgi:hypothetical protein
MTESTKRAESELERRLMAQAIGIADGSILSELFDLGLTAETVALLPVIPLVQVAWANGSVGGDERRLIYQVAEMAGVERGGSAWERLGGWLGERPPDDFFERALRVLRATLDTLPPDHAVARKRDLLAFCTRVAEASGRVTGFLALHRSIRPAEQDLLGKIAATLE